VYDERDKLNAAIAHLPDEQRKAIKDAVVECDFITHWGNRENLSDNEIASVAIQMAAVRTQVALAARRS
jgi:hypothetical protein